MNHELNPIYQPQGVSLLTLLTFKPPVERPSSVVGVAQLTAKQYRHNTKLRAASAAATARKVDAKYKAAFGGELRTVADLARELKMSRQGIIQQLHRYRAAGVVARVAQVPHSKEIIWQWV